MTKPNSIDAEKQSGQFEGEVLLCGREPIL